MLSNVIESLNRITYERIQILKPLTLVDGLSFQRYRAEYTELYLDQIRNASYLAITKMEQASAEEVRHLIRVPRYVRRIIRTRKKRGGRNF